VTETLTEPPSDLLTFPATLPVLPLKETVVFPDSMTPLAIGQERSMKLVEDVVSGDRVLALVTVRNTESEVAGWDDLYEVGTVAMVHKMMRVPDGTLRILVTGTNRVSLDRRVQDEPYLVGEFTEAPDVLEESRGAIQQLAGLLDRPRPQGVPARQLQVVHSAIDIARPLEMESKQRRQFLAPLAAAFCLQRLANTPVQPPAVGLE